MANTKAGAGRMTANPLKPARYRPGKPLVDEPSESEDEDDKEDDEGDVAAAAAAASGARMRGPASTKVGRAVRTPAPLPSRVDKRKEDEDDEDLEGFVTEDEEEEEEEDTRRVGVKADLDSGSGSRSGSRSGSGSESESGSEEEESSDEGNAAETRRKTLLRPVFVKKTQRTTAAGAAADVVGSQTFANASTSISTSETTDKAEGAAAQQRRQAQSDALIQEQLEKNAAARAAGRKAWDDDEDNLALDGEAVVVVDDTDNTDPQAEHAAWRLRELKRLKRDRAALEEAEAQRAEVERRRALDPAEREREDRAFVERQRREKEEERMGSGRMGYMAKYHHRGAFFGGGDDGDERSGGGGGRVGTEGEEEKKNRGNGSKATALGKRNIMGARFADEVDRSTLPEYMQIRDLTRLGRKGRSKYKDLRSEDTGRWGGDYHYDSARAGYRGQGRGAEHRPDENLHDQRFIKRPRVDDRR